MIKAVVFDVGGVLVLGSMSEFYRRCCAFLGARPKLNFDESPIISEKLNRGQEDARPAFERIFERELTDDEYKKVIDHWRGTWKRHDAMYELAERVRKAGLRIAILSNSDYIVSDHLKALGLYDPFEFVVLSHEVGFIKPEREIYEILIRRLALRPDEILFIDDNQKCIDAAKGAGISAIRYTDMPNLMGKIREYGIR